VSFDLFVWKRPLVETTDEATALISRDEGAFEPSAEVLDFYDEVLRRWPALESYAEEEIDAAPASWALTPERSDRLVAMNFSWSVPGDVLDTVVELARERDLVLYDPQGPSFHSPPSLDEPTPRRRDPAVLRSTLRTLLVGAALAVGGWFLPVAVLSWFLIAIGAVMVVACAAGIVVWLRE
jgi:hypothetical protein